MKGREKLSEVISKSCQRRQWTGKGRNTHRIEKGYSQVVESDSSAKPRRYREGRPSSSNITTKTIPWDYLKKLL